MKIKKLLIYPYDENAEILLWDKSFFRNYSDLETVYLCSPKGWRTKDLMISNVSNKLEYDICRENYSESIKSVELAIFTMSMYNDLTISKMEEAAKRGIIIYDLLKYNNRRQELQCICISNGGEYYYYNDNDSFSINVNELYGIGLVELKTPIVTIGSQVCSIGQEFLEFGITGFLRKEGYKTTLISSSYFAGLSENHEVPSCLNSVKYNDTEQILLFNRYLKMVEKEETSDVIVLGIPGGMMPYTNELYGDFGMTALKMFQAMRPDFFVYCMPFDLYNEAMLNKIMNCIRYRFGSEVDCINLCRKQVDWMRIDSMHPSTVPFIDVEEKRLDDYIENHTKDVAISFFSHTKHGDINKIGDQILNKLSRGVKKVVF